MADDASQSNVASEVGSQPSSRWQDEFGMAWTFLTRFPYPFAVTHDRAPDGGGLGFPGCGCSDWSRVGGRLWGCRRVGLAHPRLRNSGYSRVSTHDRRLARRRSGRCR